MRPKTTVKIVLKVVINSSFSVIPAFVFFLFVFCLFLCLLLLNCSFVVLLENAADGPIFKDYQRFLLMIFVMNVLGI